MSLKHGKPAGDDPWDAWTLEWATTSPPPSYNFETIPTVHSRRPLWDLKHPDDPGLEIRMRTVTCAETRTWHATAARRYRSRTWPRLPPAVPAEQTVLTSRQVGHGRLPAVGSGVLQHADHGLRHLSWASDIVRPNAGEVLSLPLVHLHDRSACCPAARRSTWPTSRTASRRPRAVSARWWAATIGLGDAFLLGTAYEWHDLIVKHRI